MVYYDRIPLKIRAVHYRLDGFHFELADPMKIRLINDRIHGHRQSFMITDIKMINRLKYLHRYHGIILP
jgi:hypothetical protein